MKLWLDLETFSDIPLDFGVYRYAEKARILLCAYAVDDAPARCVDCAALEPMPADFTAALKNQECEIWAHNSRSRRPGYLPLAGYHDSRPGAGIARGFA